MYPTVPVGELGPVGVFNKFKKDEIWALRDKTFDFVGTTMAIGAEPVNRILSDPKPNVNEAPVDPDEMITNSSILEYGRIHE